MIGKGIGHVGFLSYWKGEEPLATVDLHIVSDQPERYGQHKSNYSGVLSTRTLDFGGQKLPCWDLAARFGEIIDSSLVADIHCEIPTNGVYANFFGSRVISGEFYEALEHSEVTR